MVSRGRLGRIGVAPPARATFSRDPRVAEVYDVVEELGRERRRTKLKGTAVIPDLELRVDHMAASAHHFAVRALPQMPSNLD